MRWDGIFDEGVIDMREERRRIIGLVGLGVCMGFCI